MTPLFVCPTCGLEHPMHQPDCRNRPRDLGREITEVRAEIAGLRGERAARVTVTVDQHRPLDSVGLVCPCGRAVASIEGVARACTCGRVWLITAMQIGGPRG